MGSAMGCGGRGVRLRPMEMGTLNVDNLWITGLFQPWGLHEALPPRVRARVCA